MTNVDATLNPDNHDEMTIDISAITDEQRRLLSKCINYQATIPHPTIEGETIPNPLPLIAALIVDSMNTRKSQMSAILEQEGMAAVQSSAAEILDSFL